ncbi:endo-1,4-beta-glucanase [Sorangium atrum]|uniref:Endo-1,4-beta-glucanase n=1 Tax=Sorangium atrum TaxID=2995308 RepID=A0ABT5BUP4_9BACT|nr:endo-1,4-beta-glucanase [Sorangium aterium]MDC0677884.1 endo-1,4-beta-glucanase [Sorangium aterium]
MRNWLLLVGVLQLSVAGFGCGDGSDGGGDGGAGGEAGDTGLTGSSSSGAGTPAGSGAGAGTSASSGAGAGTPTGSGAGAGEPTGGPASTGSGDPVAGSSTSSGGEPSACAGAEEDECPFEAGVEIACRLRFMYGVNYAWRDFGADFGGQSKWSQAGISGKKSQVLADLQDMRANGVDVVRWWIYPRFYGDEINFDGQGNPTGLGGTSTQDILAALELADQAQVNVMFTLFSFDGFYKTSYNPPSGLSATSMGPIVADAGRRAKLIENVVRPIARTVASSPHSDRMLAWDVINEPEWAMTGPSLYGGDPAFEGDSSKFDLVTHQQMEALAKESAAVLRGETGAPVSVGSAAIKWGQAWTRSDVDFYQVHMYGWVNDNFPYSKPLSEYGLTDKPVVMGEFPINMAEMDVRYDKFVGDLYNMGYAGALSWSITDRNFPWSSNKTAVKAFADQHPCETRY